MKKNIDKLKEFLAEENGNLKVEDLELVAALNGADLDPKKFDTRFAIIRKNKRRSMAINLSKLQEIGFMVEKLDVFNGIDRLVVTVKKIN